MDVRKRFIEVLEAQLNDHPQLRIGQLLVNALGTDPFYMDDMQAFRRLIGYPEQSK